VSESKPAKLPTGENVGGSVGEACAKKRRNATRRVVFSSELRAHDVLKIVPLEAAFVSRLKKLTSFIPALKRFAHSYHASALAKDFDVSGPVAVIGQCESLMEHCLDLIGEFRKSGNSPHFQHISKTAFLATMKESYHMVPATLAQLFSGEPDPRMQKLAYEVKLLDALFNAIIAPYNWWSRSGWIHDATRGRHPFELSPMDGNPQAVHRLLHTAVQKVLQGNIGAQTYFSFRSSRVWEKVRTNIFSLPPPRRGARSRLHNEKNLIFDCHCSLTV
jgi:hypothetical protein